MHFLGGAACGATSCVKHLVEIQRALQLLIERISDAECPAEDHPLYQPFFERLELHRGGGGGKYDAQWKLLLERAMALRGLNPAALYDRKLMVPAPADIPLGGPAWSRAARVAPVVSRPHCVSAAADAPR